MKKKKIITSLSGVAALVAPAAAIATACTEEGKPTPTEIKISAMFESQEINENTPIKVTNNDTVQFSQTGGENPVWQVASNNGVEIDENGKFTVIWVPPEQTTYEITCKCDGNYSATFHLTLKAKVPAPITSITATYKGESVVENTPITVESWDVIQFNQTGGQNPVWSVSSEADAEIGGDGLLNTKEVPTQETSYLITCACNGGYRKTFNLILKSDEQTPTIEITATYKGEPIEENTPIIVEKWDTIQFTQTGGTNPVWTIDPTTCVELDESGKLTISQALDEPTAYSVTCTCDNEYSNTFNLILNADTPIPTIKITATYYDDPISEDTTVNVMNNDSIQFAQIGGTNPNWKLSTEAENISINKDTGLLTIDTIADEGATCTITCECNETTNTFTLVLKKAILLGSVKVVSGDNTWGRYHCYNNGTATLIDYDYSGHYYILVIPPTIIFNVNTYKVTRIADLSKTKRPYMGVDFSKATNLRIIENSAFEHWDLLGYQCDWDFSNTKLEYIGDYAFNNSMAQDAVERAGVDDNYVSVIKFPKTIKYIGKEAFGQNDAVDPKTDRIVFSTLNVDDIKKITFGDNWQPHQDDGCSIYLPDEDLIDAYKSVNNFNPRNYDVGVGNYTDPVCGGIDQSYTINNKERGRFHATFSCNREDKTATMIDTGVCDANQVAYVVVPATIVTDGVVYKVTKIGKLPPKDAYVEGFDFTQAANLTTIEDRAFEHWNFESGNNECRTVWDFTNTKLEYIGAHAFDNSMDSNSGGGNAINFIKFPSTIKHIGNDAFGQDGATDPKTDQIIFTTADVDAINNITFGERWQPHKDGDKSTVYVPKQELIDVYKSRANFNPHGFAIGDGYWEKCGDVNTRFHCNEEDHTATIIGCNDNDGILAVPPSINVNGIPYKVTAIAELPVKERVEGFNFCQATNLKTIAPHALEHWSLVGRYCNFDFSNTQLEEIGEKAFDNAMATGSSKNLIDIIKFPKTIKKIGKEAFGQTGSADPKTDWIVFSTTDENAIKAIEFGSKWQPHDDDDCTIYVPNENLINVYKSASNFNPNGFGVKVGHYGFYKCGDIDAKFSYDPKDGTARIIDCNDGDNVFVVPPTIKTEGIEFKVTSIAHMPKKVHVDGVDFTQATNLTTIENSAFEHWGLVGSMCNFDFSNTSLVTIGDYAFNNAMSAENQNNAISLVKFPTTIQKIGKEAFGQEDGVDPKTDEIIFTTTDETVISNITFGSKWAPHKNEGGTIFVPNAYLIDIYKNKDNFNPRGFKVAAVND